MKFGAPICLAAGAAALIFLAVLGVWSSRARIARLREAFQSPLLEQLTASVDRRRRWVKWVLRILVVTGVFLALARPLWGRKEIEVERTGADLAIALDVSRSMLAPDAGGTNRLAAAVAAAGHLLDALGGDRAALIVFAGEAYVTVPLTRDHTAVSRALASATTSMITDQGSNLGAAIKKARDCFEKGAQGARALLILSDGEQLSGDAVESARAAAKEGVRIHAAGFGSAVGARIPKSPWDSGGKVRNAMGREVVTRRDEQRLRQIASAGEGLYTRIEERDDKSLQSWWHQASASLPRKTEKRVVNEPAEQYQWPLAGALALLCIEVMVAERRSRSRSRSGLKSRQTARSATGNANTPGARQSAA